MIWRKLASGLLLSAVLVSMGCWHHGEKRQANCCPPPPCCPKPPTVVAPSGFAPQPGPVQYYYAPPPGR